MRRGFAVLWHALSFLLAGVLYFLFVLPRWWELMGEVSHGVGTALRIVTGAVVGLTALPAVVTLIKSRKPEFGTPQLALSLRQWSIVGHVLAGVLIVGTAIAEIWLSLDRAGQWLFGVYGAAAAIALLAAIAFYLAFVAELPPAPPKPLKPKKNKEQPVEADTETLETETLETETLEVETREGDEPTEGEVAETADPEVTAETAAEPEAAEPEAETAAESAAEPARNGLRNRRPAGKARGSGRRGRGAGGVAVSDN